ncbi:hypothetical protein MVES_000071 [Malassezia vespertilionis]|uniref:Uncharacterized protein n=1 Tax=Malassezia vespertilionis TaxID=2020962 RepID=A0A2N1JG87_9BASI|nr:hypothetical protein MVES_000071 [Malassezia vespertilionis]
MNKRATSAADVFHTDKDARRFTRASSEYNAISSDIQTRLQSMSWRIRSNVHRGYVNGTPRGMQCTRNTDTTNVQDMLQDARSAQCHWGRTASVPFGALRGESAEHDSCAWNNELKRGISEDDSDAVLASAFEENELAWQGAVCEMNMVDDNWENIPAPERTSMPPLRELPADYNPFLNRGAEAMDQTVEMHERVDFATYAQRTDNF